MPFFFLFLLLSGRGQQHSLHHRSDDFKIQFTTRTTRVESVRLVKSWWGINKFNSWHTVVLLFRIPLAINHFVCEPSATRDCARHFFVIPADEIYCGGRRVWRNAIRQVFTRGSTLFSRPIPESCAERVETAGNNIREWRSLSQFWRCTFATLQCTELFPIDVARGTSAHLTPGQMLQKLSPLNSAFDKSHYSLPGPPYRSCIHFSAARTPLFSLPFSAPAFRFYTSGSTSAPVNFAKKKFHRQGDTVAGAERNRIKIRSKFTNWRFDVCTR